MAPKPKKSKRRLWRLVLLMLLCLVGSAAVSFVVFVNVEAKIPRELAGTWQVIEGPLAGSTLEFRGDGTTIATKSERGKKVTTQASAKVEGKTIFLTAKDDLTGKDDTVRQTIIRLTDDELIISDMDRHIYRMKRVGS
jgi:uncharacterized protein (TIGR03066 family)